MSDLISQWPCDHAFSGYCAWGCHDRIDYVADNAGMELVLMLLEQWANTGRLDDFHATLDPHSGKDGLDECTEGAVLVMHEEETI